jgi:signal transduction histidine kinase/ActR/RegA family two-component response regulator
VSERILILAPRGRDGEVVRQVLLRDGTTCKVCPDLECLRHCLEGDVGGLLVTEEALAGPFIGSLLDWCDRQPAWSDIPIIVMATKRVGHRSPVASGILARLGNVVVLERPVNAETLASAARASIRARRRQYEARSRLLEQERNAQALLELNESLERRVEERTRELDQAYETLEFALDSAAMGSWDVDLVTEVARRTPHHDRIFGYLEPLATWSRPIFLDHVLAEDRARATAAMDGALVGGTLDLECRIRRADGAVRWIVAKGKVGYRDGQPIRMAGIVMDTTERRTTEDALHQSQKMEAIGQLTGGVAHDFNNLLTVIVGGLDLVMRKPDNPERVARLAGAAMSAARRGEQLTQQLLAFSRRQMLRPQSLDPNRLLRDFEGLARRAAGGSVTLEFQLDPGAGPINVDPAQFESAVLNLVVNARDAMPDGGTITVTTGSDELAGAHTPILTLPAGPYVVIAVTDTGSGIDADTLKHVFEPFFTTKDVGKGTGLGLSQVYGFVRGGGGDVVIDTEIGRGTSFRLYLPRSSEPGSQEGITILSARPIETSESGETILLVEDDEQVLQMAIESLEELRYTVLVCRNAYEAIQRLKEPSKIDILFSDVVMPGGMNGGQLAEEARRLRPGLKVLLTSGYVGEFEKSHPIAGDIEVLTKPYRRDELAAKLRGVSGAAARHPGVDPVSGAPSLAVHAT